MGVTEGAYFYAVVNDWQLESSSRSHHVNSLDRSRAASWDGDFPLQRAKYASSYSTKMMQQKVQVQLISSPTSVHDTSRMHVLQSCSQLNKVFPEISNDKMIAFKDLKFQHQKHLSFVLNVHINDK